MPSPCMWPAPWPLPGPAGPARPLWPQLSMAQPPSLDHAQKLSQVDFLRVSLLWRPVREARDFILEHYSEDGYLYEDEIADLMDLRQACRTPSWDEARVELLMTYFIQLGFVESQFFPPTWQMGLLFTW
nr:rhophilin-2-like [Symphalangus syndactylus]